jgi:hypothetical protein
MDYMCTANTTQNSNLPNDLLQYVCTSLLTADCDETTHTTIFPYFFWSFLYPFCLPLFPASKSPASEVRLTSLRDQAHQPQQSGSPPPATKTGSPTTCHRVSLHMRLLYIQLSETDMLLFSPHNFFTYSCLRQTRFYSHSTPSLLNSCLRKTRFLFSLHIFSIHTCTSLLSDIRTPLLCHENSY